MKSGVGGVLRGSQIECFIFILTFPAKDWEQSLSFSPGIVAPWIGGRLRISHKYFDLDMEVVVLNI